MTRPGVSVVMPFAGSAGDGAEALAALGALQTGGEDELILADNSGLGLRSERVRVIPVTGERSPSHARNVGAEQAGRDWILFLDADCRAVPDILERYFARPVAASVGALAGEVAPAPGGGSLAERYGVARSFLGQGAHLAHPFLPRAVAANLLVRREAFAAVGGFYEGVRAAEDTDFSWRLQKAGWELVARPEARVEHRYRTTLEGLRRQWRGYAAGRAWLARRYEDFEPQPALTRAGGRALTRLGRRRGSPPPRRGQAPSGPPPGHLERGRFAALDAVLGIEELAGFLLSNRPQGAVRTPARVVLVAERFPRRGDPLSDFARTLAGARVEATARPEAFDPAAARTLAIDYREDDGAAARASGLIRLLIRHPLRGAADYLHRREGDPGLAALAPGVLRLRADPAARVHPLGGAEAHRTAERMAKLAGRPLQDSSP
ncbi:MAG TPA: glycosyltransferase family 2 protein [Solirubrobacteraceae bacterium]